MKLILMHQKLIGNKFHNPLVPPIKKPKDIIVKDYLTEMKQNREKQEILNATNPNYKTHSRK